MSQDHRHKLDKVKERIQDLQAGSVRAFGQDAGIWGRQEEIIELLSTVAENLSDVSEVRGQEHIQIIQQVATIESNIDHIKRDVGLLCKLVRDGNGQPSIIQRLANLETVVHNQTRDIEQIGQHANSIMAARMLTKSQIITGLTGMVITALLSSLALFATLLKP
jgi:hypothetical protein